MKPGIVPNNNRHLDEWLADARTGKAAQNVLVYLQEACARKLAAVQSRIVTDIGRHRLTPEMALAAWHEVSAITSLHNTVTKDILKGQGASAKLTPVMEGTPDDG